LSPLLRRVRHDLGSGRPAPDIRIPDYSESNDQAQQIKKAVQKFQDNIVTPEGVRITVESVDVTMLDNEVRADQVVKTAPPPYSEVEQRPLRILSLGELLRARTQAVRADAPSQTAEVFEECLSLSF
jgi:hypothetical protein